MVVPKEERDLFNWESIENRTGWGPRSNVDLLATNGRAQKCRLSRHSWDEGVGVVHHR